MTYRWRRQREPGTGTGAITFYASDAFTDTTNTVITSHTPIAVASAPAGTAWVATNGAVPDIQIQGNRVTKVGVSAGGQRAALNGGVTPSDQSVTADFVCVTNIDGQITGVCARASTADVSGYYLEYTTNTGTPATCFFVLLRIDASFVSTQVGSNFTVAYPGNGVTIPVEIRCVGGAISANINGTVSAISGVDGSPLTGTRAGVFFQQGAGGSSTLTTGCHIDNLVVRSPS